MKKYQSVFNGYTDLEYNLNDEQLKLREECSQKVLDFVAMPNGALLESAKRFSGYLASELVSMVNSWKDGVTFAYNGRWKCFRIMRKLGCSEMFKQ
jgi:hypothetical protein